MAVGKPLHLRLFLEGVETPVVAAQVSINVNGPAVASIQIVPLDEAMELHPRTMVHLFYLDHIDPNLPPERFLENYKLLFCGETVGFSFVQTPQSRGLVLQCLDFSSYWDAAHATAIEYGPAGNLFTNQAALHGSNAALFDDIVNQQQERLVQWLKQRPTTPGLESVSGLAGGIIHMLEAIGGVPKHAKGINDFFTIAELRCRILQQITAEENDNTAAGLLREKVFDQWLRTGLQNAGQQVTFRDMMKLLFSYIYYESVPNPVAKFDPDVSAKISKKSVGGQGKLPLNQTAIALKAKEDINTVSVELGVLQQLEGLDILQEFGPEPSQTNFYGPSRQKSSRLKEIISELKSLGSAASKAVNEVLKATAILDRLVPDRPENLKKKLDQVAIRLTNAIYELTHGTKPVRYSTRSTTTKSSKGELARLRTQIIRPDCWFSAPPKCNVIFPEQYTQLSYDRTFIQEVTRSLVMVYNTLIGPDALLADRVLAPTIGLSAETLTKTGARKSYRALMEHEYHTGIIPRTEWLANTSSFGGGADDSRGYRMGWAKKIALFHFFKYRFGPRQASLSGRFNPNIVCGFPALVIHRPYIVPDISGSQSALSGDVVDRLSLNAKAYNAPSQLVGMVGALNHNVDQSGGTTQVSMHHVRQHLGIDDEFLRILVNEKTKTKRRVRVPLVASELKDDRRLLTLLASATPSLPSQNNDKSYLLSQKPKTVSSQSEKMVRGKWVKETVSLQVSSSSSTQLQEAPSPVANGRIEGLEREVSVPNPPGKTTAGSSGVFGKIVGVEVLDPSIVEVGGKRVFSSVVFHEDVETTQESPKPIEEILRPNFFSSAYSNEKIGERIYMPFFGTGSIVDEVRVIGVGTGESSDGIVVSASTERSELLDVLSKEARTQGRNSIERATNFIGYVYGVVKSQGKDVDDFIRTFTHRPVATLVDMLGSEDLEVRMNGTKVEVVQGTFGFHSHAVHDTVVRAGPLAGLTDDPNASLQRLEANGKTEEILRAYDIRSAKRERVLAYAQALVRSRGIPG